MDQVGDFLTWLIGGVLIGAIIGIALDRRSQKRVRTVQAERQSVEAAPEADAAPDADAS